MAVAHDLVQRVGVVRHVHDVAALGEGQIVKLGVGVGRFQFHGLARGDRRQAGVALPFRLARGRRRLVVPDKAVPLGDAEFAAPGLLLPGRRAPGGFPFIGGGGVPGRDVPAALEDQHVVLRGVGGKLEGEQHGGTAQIFQEPRSRPFGGRAVEVRQHVFQVPARAFEFAEVIPRGQGMGYLPAREVGIRYFHGVFSLSALQ